MNVRRLKVSGMALEVQENYWSGRPPVLRP